MNTMESMCPDGPVLTTGHNHYHLHHSHGHEAFMEHNHVLHHQHHQQQQQQQQSQQLPYYTATATSTPVYMTHHHPSMTNGHSHHVHYAQHYANTPPQHNHPTSEPMTPSTEPATTSALGSAPYYYQHHNHMPQLPPEVGAAKPKSTGITSQLKKSSLKKISKFGSLARSTQSLNILPGSKETKFELVADVPGGQTAKRGELLTFSLKGGPPWGFRIKQRNGTVFISKVNCGGRGHKGGLRVHDEIISVNAFELDHHPTTLRRNGQPISRPESRTGDGEDGDENEEDEDQLTKLDFAYQLIKHTLNRRLELVVRRWHSDWELSRGLGQRSRGLGLSTNTIAAIGSNDDTEGPHHQSEEELLSPNEDFGPQSRTAHGRMLAYEYQHPQSQTPEPTADFLQFYQPHSEIEGEFLLPPPRNLGFSSDSPGGSSLSTELADHRHSHAIPLFEPLPHLGLYSSASNGSSSTTTTGCLIAAAEAEIRQAAEAVITPSDSISECTSRTETPCTESDTSQFTPLTSLNAANVTLAGGLLEQPQQSVQLQQQQQQPQQVRHHRRRRRHRKGQISLIDTGSEDQSSDIGRLDLSPSLDSYSSSSSTLSDSDSEELQTIRRRSKSGSSEKVHVPPSTSNQTLNQNRPRTPRNIWSPSSSSPTSPNVALLNSSETAGSEDIFSDIAEPTDLPVYNLHDFSQHQHLGQSQGDRAPDQETTVSDSLVAHFGSFSLDGGEPSPAVYGPIDTNLGYFDFHPPLSTFEQYHLHHQHPHQLEHSPGSSTLPRSMQIMTKVDTSVPHVAEVYQPRQHQTHKYWTLPRSIVAGVPLPGAGPYLERQNSDVGLQPEMAEKGLDEVDRFHQRSPAVLPHTPGSSMSKSIRQEVLQTPQIPEGAQFLYETDSATFYTAPTIEAIHTENGDVTMTQTTQTTTTYAVPKRHQQQQQQQQQQSRQPQQLQQMRTTIGSTSNAARTAPTISSTTEQTQLSNVQQQQQQPDVNNKPAGDVSQQQSTPSSSEWYKAWCRDMQSMERVARHSDADAICVKVKKPHYKGSDYHLALEGDTQQQQKYIPGSIADYEPGKSSISEHEKQLFYEDIFNYIDTIFAEVIASTGNAQHTGQLLRSKRARSLSRMASLTSAAATAGTSTSGASDTYGTIGRPSRSLPSLTKAALMSAIASRWPPYHYTMLRKGATAASTSAGVSRSQEDVQRRSSMPTMRRKRKLKKRPVRAQGEPSTDDDASVHDEEYDDDDDDDATRLAPEVTDEQHEADIEDNQALETDGSSQAPKTPTSTYYHEKCVFNTLTQGTSGVTGSASGSGYDSDSSYVIRKNRLAQQPKPATHEVYQAVQRGEEIPMQGLQMSGSSRDYRQVNQNYNHDQAAWDEIDSWQNQIQNDFDQFYSALNTSVPYSGRNGVSNRPTPQIPKKRVVFNQTPSVKEVTMVDEFEEVDDDEMDVPFGPMGTVEEEEYSYAGLLRPVSHRRAGTARSLEHYLNTQDLSTSVDKLKTGTGINDRVRVRRHRRRRSKSPAAGRSSEEPDYDYSIPVPSSYSPRMNSSSTVRTIDTTIYGGQDDGKVNVQTRMPTNTGIGHSHTDVFSPRDASTPLGGRGAAMPRYGMTSPLASTVADSSFSMPARTPLLRTGTPTGITSRGPCGEGSGVGGYNMTRHHFVPGTQSPVALDRFERTQQTKEIEPRRMAKVIYDFHPQNGAEIAVKKGDFITVRKTVNQNWIEIEDPSSGLIGMIPKTHVDFEQSLGSARAKYDFGAKTAVEVSFRKGERLTLLRRVDANWYEGMNEKQEVGIFPVSYVEPVKQSMVRRPASFIGFPPGLPPVEERPRAQTPPSVASGQLSSHTASTSNSSFASIIEPPKFAAPPQPSSRLSKGSLTPPSSVASSLAGPSGIPQHNHPLPLPPSSSHQQSIYFSSTISEPGTSSSASAPSGIFGPQTPSGSGMGATYEQHIKRAPDAVRHLGASGERFCLPKPRIYRVLYPYKPHQIDELELQYGDLLTVTIQCDDGWFLGRSTISGKFGTFPGNYVEPV